MTVPRLQRRFLPQYGGASYADIIRSIQPEDFIACWPLFDSLDATVASEVSGRFDGAPTNVTFQNAPFFTQGNNAYFDGTAYVDLPTAELDVPFDPNNITMLCWINNAVLSAANEFAFQLGVDSNNRCILRSAGAINQWQWQYNAGGTTNVRSAVIASGGLLTEWTMVAIVVDNSNYMRCWLNDGLGAADQTANGVWAGALADLTCAIGAYNTTPLLPFTGNIAFASLWSGQLSNEKLEYLYRCEK